MTDEAGTNDDAFLAGGIAAAPLRLMQIPQIPVTVSLSRLSPQADMELNALSPGPGVTAERCHASRRERQINALLPKSPTQKAPAQKKLLTKGFEAIALRLRH